MRYCHAVGLPVPILVCYLEGGLSVPLQACSCLVGGLPILFLYKSVVALQEDFLFLYECVVVLQE